MKAMNKPALLFDRLFWCSLVAGAALYLCSCTQEKRDAMGEALVTPTPALDNKSPSQTLQEKIPEVAVNPLDIEAWLKIAGAITTVVTAGAVGGTKKGRALVKAGVNKVRRKKKPDVSDPLPPV